MYDEDLTNLDEWLRRLKVEYDIFFSGHRKKPPDDLRSRVEKLVKRLSEVQNMSFSERFRYNTLVTRFYVFRDRWRRTLLSRELGAEARSEIPAAAKDSIPATPMLRISIADPEAEDGKVRELYDALVSVREKHANASAISFQQFASYIARQTQSIRGKYGCSSVLFTIAQEEDAIRFTATAETDPSNQQKPV